MNTARIEFPPRKVKVVNADIEIEVVLPESEFNELLRVFQKHEMSPLMRLRIKNKSGESAEFTNLQLEKVHPKLEYVS